MDNLIRANIVITPEIRDEIQKLKKKYYDKSYAEIYRMVIKEGLKVIKQSKNQRGGEVMEIYTTSDLCKLLKVNRSKIQWLRENQLLKARKLGKGFITTEDELKEFMELTAGLDLSSKRKQKSLV